MYNDDNILILHDKIKEKIDNNLYISYLKSLWDKYKIVILFLVAVILVAFIEIRIATCSSDCSYALDKHKILKISPPCLDLPDGVYIYVYNSNTYNSDEVCNMTGIDSEYYNKLVVTEHITNQIMKPMNKIKEGFKNVFTNGTPVNTITDNLINGYKLRSIVDPSNTINDLSSKWCVLYPDNIHLNCFTSDNNIYFSNNI